MTQNTVEGFRISPQQKRIFNLLESRQNDNPYFVQFSINIEGILETKTLKNSLIKLIKDHEILRTKFHSIPDMDLPIQVIEEIHETNETKILLVKEHHLSDFSNINEKIDEVFNQLFTYPLDLKKGPIIVCEVITLSENQHTLLFKLPSLLADSSTIQNFVDKLFQLYEAFFDHQALPEDSILQYADLAEWQNELLEDETAEYGRNYWQQQNVFTAADLPLPLEHPVQQSDFDPDWIQNEIPSNVASQLTQLATQIDASEDLILLACCYSLLWRLGIGDQITIGTELNGRKYEELNQTLGLLAKFVPIHGYCHNDQVIKALLNDLAPSLKKAQEFQEYFSPDLLQEAFNQQQALFPICFSFIEQGQPIQTDHLSISIGKQYICTEPFKIKFQFIQQQDNLQFQIYYDRQIFTKETIQRIHLYYQSLLDSIIQFPESPISQLNILDSHERQQLLVNLNQTTTEYPNDALIHTLFEQQAKWNCDRIALCSEGNQFTYSEINSRANQLAHYLQTLIAEPNPVVGLYFQRSAEWIIGMLAILKAGGAYLPLDPSLPQESLAFRLKDAQASIILTQQHLLETLPETSASVVAFDAQWEDIAQMNTNNLNIELTPKHLAYALFTSGSTGQPKGVAVEHQQLLNYYYAISKQLDFSQCHDFANVSTFAADLGNTTIFPSLCRGGNLHIISQERATNPEAFVNYFQDHPIDCLKIVPSHLNALLTASQPEQILPKQQLILGGEACHWHLIEEIQQYSPTCHIVNHYGPTETTIGALTYSIQPQSQARETETVPIGTPIANTQVYILDANLQPVPMDIPGQMYIGGAGVTRGYLNRPELTAERFIPNPFGTSGERLYKTGDLARYRSDGTIEFIGRADDQVKIHGFRIELGEIEATLNQHPAIGEAIALACADDSGKQRLIAYVVSEPDASTTTEQLREFLQEKLPPYMIPSAFIWLKAFPLNANGKVDRQALPDPETTRGDLEGTFVGPRTPTEQILADIWAQFLKRDQIDVRDNFFELGGDSILSMQIMAKAHQAGLQLTPQQIFEHQTIAELAEVAGGQSELVQAEQGWVTGHVPLTPIQHWFFEQQLPEPHHWNQSVLLEVPQKLDFGRFEQALIYLLEHHDALRFRFEPTASGWQQTATEPEGNVPFTEVDLSHVPSKEQNSVLSTAAAQLQTSLDLSRGPLARVAWFHLDSRQPSRLLVIIHHLVVDGVSWRILLEDLETAYQQLSDGESVQLPRKTTSFQQWTQRLQDYAGSETLRSEQDYWLAPLNQPVPKVPMDYPEGSNRVADAGSIAITFNSTETQALLQEVPSVYQTQINEVLLTALALAFQEWTGQSSLRLDLEGHGREEIFDDIDLSRTVGWFTTIFPVQLQLKETSHLGENLKAIQQQLRNIPDRGIGYGILRYLTQDRQISEQLKALPNSPIRFNYLGQSDQVFQDSSLFAPAQEATGSARSPFGNRPYLIDINGMIRQSQLQLTWNYSQAVHHPATIEQFAQHFQEALRSLINHCQSLQSRQTVSDQAETRIKSNAVAALEAEATLDASIEPDPDSPEPADEPSCIFLTGATGFLGAFLLHELLQQTNADIYCLVRASSSESAKQRLQDNLQAYQTWDESLRDRVIPIVGDLSQPLLGLSDEQFQQLSNQIDVIYHNAATINLVYPYTTLKASNVLGTQEILRLASHNKLKPVHYISTLSVLSSESYAQITRVPELHQFKHCQIPSGGYVQTKWIAEKLVSIASARGIPACIYRIGRVSGHSKTGVCNTNDRLYRMIKGFIQLGCAPDANTTIDMTPVDYLSQAIINLSQQKSSFNEIFHLSNPKPIQSFELFDWIRQFGYSLQPMSHQQWQAKLLDESESSLNNPLYPLIPFFRGQKDTSETASLNPTASHSKTLNFNHDNTTQKLAKTSIQCPPVDANLLKTYFSYLINIGFLDAPDAIKMKGKS